MFSAQSGHFPPEFISRILLFILIPIIGVPFLLPSVVEPLSFQPISGLIVGYLVWNYFWSGYEVYLSLGAGGNTSDVYGFFWTKFQAMFIIDDVTKGPTIPYYITPQTGAPGVYGEGLLDKIPRRWGPRPLMKGLAPQRQFNQFPGNREEMFLETNKMLRRFLLQRSYLRRDKSTGHVSKPSYSLWVKPTTDTRRMSQAEWFFDVGHPHEIDGSLHFSLHPADVKRVVEQGFGERHPLARRGSLWRWFWCKFYKKDAGILRAKGFSTPENELVGRCPVNDGLVFVYAPRTPAELVIVKLILAASCWYVAGKYEADTPMPEDDDEVSEIDPHGPGDSHYTPPTA